MPTAPGLAPVTGFGFGFRPWYKEQSPTTPYQVLAGDSGSLFLTSGGASFTFTLPTLANGIGFCAWFYNVQGFNMIITAPANKLICFNNATGTTATWSTAGQLIGACACVWMNDAGTFYHLMNFGRCAETIT